MSTIWNAPRSSDLSAKAAAVAFDQWMTEAFEDKNVGNARKKKHESTDEKEKKSQTRARNVVEKETRNARSRLKNAQRKIDSKNRFVRPSNVTRTARKTISIDTLEGDNSSTSADGGSLRSSCSSRSSSSRSRHRKSRGEKNDDAQKRREHGKMRMKAKKKTPKAFRRLNNALRNHVTRKRRCPGNVCKQMQDLRSKQDGASFFETKRTWHTIPYRHLPRISRSDRRCRQEIDGQEKRRRYGSVSVCNFCYDVYASSVLGRQKRPDAFSYPSSSSSSLSSSSKMFTQSEARQTSSASTRVEGAKQKKETTTTTKTMGREQHQGRRRRTKKKTTSRSTKIRGETSKASSKRDDDDDDDDDMWAKLEDIVFKTQNLDVLIELTDAHVRRAEAKEEKQRRAAKMKAKDDKSTGEKAPLAAVHPLMVTQIENMSEENTRKISAKHRLLQSLLSGGEINRERLIELKKVLRHVRKEEKEKKKTRDEEVASETTSLTDASGIGVSGNSESIASTTSDFMSNECRVTDGKPCSMFTPSDFLPKYCSRCSFFKSEHVTNTDMSTDNTTSGTTKSTILFSPAIADRLDAIFSLRSSQDKSLLDRDTPEKETMYVDENGEGEEEEKGVEENAPAPEAPIGARGSQ